MKRSRIPTATAERELAAIHAAVELATEPLLAQNKRLRTALEGLLADHKTHCCDCQFVVAAEEVLREECDGAPPVR